MKREIERQRAEERGQEINGERETEGAREREMEGGYPLRLREEERV